MQTLIKPLLVVLFIVGAIALVRDTAYNGHDFSVFWRTASYTLNGLPTYSVARDGAMVFKYPPWIVPLFFPFALLTEQAALWIWGILQVISLAAIILFLIQSKIDRKIIGAVTILYWGLWVDHALDGQIVLLLLASSLWLGATQSKSHIKETAGQMTLAYALSTKIFTLFALGDRVGFWLKAKNTLKIVAIFGVLSLPSIWAAPRHNPIELFKSWITAATSGGPEFGYEKIHGYQNQGLPALVLRNLPAPSLSTYADYSLSLLFSILLGAIWYYYSARLNGLYKWVGWIGLAPVIHPLPWYHLFIFTFPLAVASLDAAKQTRDNKLIALGIMACVMIAAINETTLGPLGRNLELLSIKSWGTLLCAAILVISNRKWTSFNKSTQAFSPR